MFRTFPGEMQSVFCTCLQAFVEGASDPIVFRRTRYYSNKQTVDNEQLPGGLFYLYLNTPKFLLRVLLQQVSWEEYK